MSVSSPLPSHRPKALLFDIGGVCVVSPMSAILDYERSKGIPPGWVNYSISRSAPNGSWHKLERGEILMDQTFFAAFKADLQNPRNWTNFLSMLAKRQAQKAGRPEPDLTSADLPPLPDVDAEAMFWEMMRVAREPDPYMAPALRRLKASGRFLVAALSNTSIFPPGHPFGMPPADPDLDVRSQFDLFVSSAHVGLRKPEQAIYELALRWMGDAYRAGTWGGGGKERGELKPSDVVFLDDIGENLKMGRKVGMQTIKVPLGRTKEVVKQLEQLTGLSLLEEDFKPKI